MLFTVYLKIKVLILQVSQRQKVEEERQLKIPTNQSGQCLRTSSSWLIVERTQRKRVVLYQRSSVIIIVLSYPLLDFLQAFLLTYLFSNHTFPVLVVLK